MTVEKASKQKRKKQTIENSFRIDVRAWIAEQMKMLIDDTYTGGLRELPAGVARVRASAKWGHFWLLDPLFIFRLKGRKEIFFFFFCRFGAFDEKKEGGPRKIWWIVWVSRKIRFRGCAKRT